jgi:uncharacterized protein (TIGR00269 family)
VRCDDCSQEAVIDQPYRGAHLCGTHLKQSVEERARREMHRQFPGFRGGTVAVAVSGGKDSAVALSLTARYFARRPNVRLVAVTVDEGVAGYRNRTIPAAASLCADLGISHRVVSAQRELGITTDQATSRLPGLAPCSYCGVWRRRLLNSAAKDENADVLVLGFNLDDLAQTVLMNLARADLGRMGRMAPHHRRRPGLVPRIAPLAGIPEREVYLYARLANLPFDHAECPYAGAAARNIYRDVLWRLEEAIPGTRHALLRTQERVVTLLGEADSPGPVECRECGEPASGALCRGCEYLERARNSFMAPAGSGVA